MCCRSEVRVNVSRLKVKLKVEKPGSRSVADGVITSPSSIHTGTVAPGNGMGDNLVEAIFHSPIDTAKSHMKWIGRCGW